MASNVLGPIAHAAGYALLRKGLHLTQSRRTRAFVEGAKRPRDAQLSLLRRILTENVDTEFGKRHGFSRVDGAAAYRQAVPLQTYEDLRPLIEQQELTGEQCLTMEQPVYYHRTSGTVGAPKNIPVTASGLKRMKHDQQMGAYVWSRDSAILEGKAFAISGQTIEGRMEGGTPFGSASGLLYKTQSRFVRSKYVLPAELADIEDYEARYLAMVVHGLAEPGVTGIATANPSTFLRLLSVADQNADVVLGAIASGRLPGSDSLPAAMGRGLRARPQRASYLADRFEATGRFTYTDIWPNLKGVVTWTGGSCGTALHGLSGLLPADIPIIEVGYLASEFRGTLNIDARNNVCLPTLFQTYFEFAEWSAREAGSAEFLGHPPAPPGDPQSPARPLVAFQSALATRIPRHLRFQPQRAATDAVVRGTSMPPEPARAPRNPDSPVRPPMRSTMLRLGPGRNSERSRRALPSGSAGQRWRRSCARDQPFRRGGVGFLSSPGHRSSTGQQ